MSQPTLTRKQPHAMNSLMMSRVLKVFDSFCSDVIGGFGHIAKSSNAVDDEGMGLRDGSNVTL